MRHSIFHLVALRQTLTTLVIIGNPKITNDSIPALTLMDKLRVLCLEDTGVTMVGLRRLAAFISDRFDVTSEVGIDFSLSVPESCRAYLDGKSKACALTIAVCLPIVGFHIYRPSEYVSH